MSEYNEDLKNDQNNLIDLKRSHMVTEDNLKQAQKRQTFMDVPQIYSTDESRTMPNLHGFIKMKPEIYDGNIEFDDYEERFSSLATLNGWDNKTKSLILSIMLYGPARTFFSTLPDVVRFDYLQLVDRLKRRFGSLSKHPMYWASQLDERSRQIGESVAKFADEIFLLVKKAYPTEMTYNNLQQVALQYFYKSLDPEMKYKCIERGCTELRQAVAIVDLYESIVGENKPLKNSDSEVNVTKLHVNLENKIYGLQTKNQINTSISRPILGSKSVIEHQAMKSKSSNNLLINQQNRNDSCTKCYACGSMTHLIRHCSLLKNKA